MASNLRVDNIQPTTGTGIGIGTANGSVTFNADVTGGLNVTTGLVGLGTDNPDHELHLYSGTLGIGKSENVGYEILIDENNLSFSRDTKSYINQKGTGTISVRLGSSYTEVAEFTSDGLKLPSGKGIDFSATADGSGTTTSEVLNDYEEGTFDLTVVMSSSGSVTLNTSYDTMSYTKIGRLVTITGSIRISSVSSPVGNLQVSNLPFTVAAGTQTARSQGSIYYYDSSAGTGNYYKIVPGRVLESTTIFDVLINHWNGTLVPAAGDEIHFGCTYITT